MASPVQQRLVEVGRKHLELARARRFLDAFLECHGNGIGLLTGRTAEHPHAERFVTAPLEELRKHFALEHVKSFRVAEETRYANEHIGVKGVQFLGVASKEMDVVLQRLLLVQHHAPGDAPLDGGGLVEREIHCAMVAEEKKKIFE